MKGKGFALTGLLVAGVFYALARPLRPVQHLSCPGLSSVLDSSGFRLEPSGWGLSPVAWGRSGAMGPLLRRAPRRDGPRVRYERPGILEWHEARREGIEQAFEVLEKPQGSGPLVVEQEVRGALEVVEASPQAIEFGREGRTLLAYRDLKASDASGRALPARMRLAGRLLALEVDDAGAQYPVSIDPLATTANWVVEGNQASDNFGMENLAPAGDVNGDGYADVIVGAQLYDNGEADEGRAYVYHGGASGLSTTASWVTEVNQATAKYGAYVSTAGDVNGDGYSDVVVSASLYDNGEANEGRAYVYHGGPNGLSTTAAWVVETDTASVGIQTVTCAGDVNGDGYSDVAIANATSGGNGKAWLYHGSQAGLSTTANWTYTNPGSFCNFGGNGYGGRELMGIGDVNGDGFSDLAIGGYSYGNGEAGEGRVFVFHGSSTGLGASPALVFEPNLTNSQWGLALAGGDVNGDGYSDLIVGSPIWTNGEADEGRTSVYHGAAAGLNTTAAWATELNQAGADYGWYVGSADVNGDGYSDVLAGSDAYTNGEANEGRIWVYHGGANGASTTAVWTAEANQASGFEGNVVDGLDVNGDGFADVLSGASNYSNGEAGEGRAYVEHDTEGTVTRNTYDLPGARLCTTRDPGDALMDSPQNRVARDSNGFWYFAWNMRNESTGSLRNILLSYTTTSTPTAASAWATVTLTDYYGTGVIQKSPAKDAFGGNPVLAMSTDDQLHFAWHSNNGGSFYWTKCTNLAALTQDASWLSPVAVEAVSSWSAVMLDMVLDASDVPHVVYGDSNSVLTRYTKYDTATAVFLTPKTLATVLGYRPRIAVDLDNNVYVVYHPNTDAGAVWLLCSTNAYTTSPANSIWKNLAQTTTDADVVHSPSTTLDTYTAADLCVDRNNVCHVAWRVAPGNGDNSQRIAVRDGFIKDGWQAGAALISTPGPWKRPVAMAATGDGNAQLFSIANGGPKRDSVYATTYTAYAGINSRYHNFGTWGAASATSDLAAGSSQAIWTERSPWRGNAQTMWFLANDAKHRISTSWTDRQTVTAGWRPPTPTLNKVHPHLVWAFPNTRAPQTGMNDLVVSQTSKSAAYTLEGSGSSTPRLYAVDRVRGYMARSASVKGTDTAGNLLMSALAVQSNVHFFLAGSTPDTANEAWVESLVDNGTTLARDPAWANNPKYITLSTNGYALTPLPITQSGSRYLYMVAQDNTVTKLFKFTADNGNTSTGFPVGSGTNYADTGTEPPMRILNDQVFFPGNVSQIYRRESDGSGEIVSSVIPNVVKHLMMVRNSNRLFVAPQDSYVYDLTSGLKTTDWASGRSADLGAVKTSGAYWTQTRNVIFVGVGNQVYQLNASTGAIQSNWPMATVGNIVTLPVAWKTFVYFGSDSGRLYAVNATSNVARANWPVVLDTAVAVPKAKTLAFDGVYGHVYLSTDEGRVYKFVLE